MNVDTDEARPLESWLPEPSQAPRPRDRSAADATATSAPRLRERRPNPFKSLIHPSSPRKPPREQGARPAPDPDARPTPGPFPALSRMAPAKAAQKASIPLLRSAIRATGAMDAAAGGRRAIGKAPRS
ncbi:hypothetical protein GCM10012280_15770 [Wenjunlia tyrosinilytica]|uniref:Uncharacterized protein n=1 Tax=Wenjunlia tyrosinilytica TaxID=1544741 RepID=A0A917ZK77_9ACTN|nr:hypothetical protein GCM10012280_15770 [Wenjunlia tyrosinilytica]